MISGVRKNQFISLVKKEILADKFLNILAAALILAVNLIIVFSTREVKKGPEPMAVSIGMFALITGFWVFIVSVRSMSKEWDLNTCYLLISLPISGIKLLSSKIVSIIFLFTLYCIEGSAMALIIGFMKKAFEGVNIKPEEWPLLFVNLLLLFIYALVILTFFIVLFQMAFIISRLVNKFGKILTVVSMFSLCWVYMRATIYLSKLIDLIGLPHIRLLIIEEGVFPPVNVSPIIAGVIIIAGFFFITAKLFDNVIEV